MLYQSKSIKQIADLNKQKRYLYAELKIKKDTLKKQYKAIQKDEKISLDINTDKAVKQLNNVTLFNITAKPNQLYSC